MLKKYEHQIYDCTRCGFCRVWGWKGVEYVCPTYPHTSAWETEYARGRVRLARATMEGEVEITDALLEHAYECTLCGNCEAHCPIELPLVDIFHAWREELVEKGHILETHQKIAYFIDRFDNPYGPKPDEEIVPAYARKEKASVLFYPGCTNNRMAVEEVEAVAEVFKKLELDFAVFDEDTCCGIPLYEVGQMEGFRRVAGKTLDLIRQYEPDVIVTSCPACFKAFKSIYLGEETLAHDIEVAAHQRVPASAGRREAGRTGAKGDLARSLCAGPAHGHVRRAAPVAGTGSGAGTGGDGIEPVRGALLRGRRRRLLHLSGRSDLGGGIASRSGHGDRGEIPGHVVSQLLRPLPAIDSQGPAPHPAGVAGYADQRGAR